METEHVQGYGILSIGHFSEFATFKRLQKTEFQSEDQAARFVP